MSREGDYKDWPEAVPRSERARFFWREGNAEVEVIGEPRNDGKGEQVQIKYKITNNTSADEKSVEKITWVPVEQLTELKD